MPIASVLREVGEGEDDLAAFCLAYYKDFSDRAVYLAVAEGGELLIIYVKCVRHTY